MNRIYLLLVVIVLFSGCDDREKRDKALKDLDATQQALIDVNTEISNLEAQLTSSLGELEVAKDDLSQVKEFQLLRAEAEREQQIRNATEYKLRIEQNIETIKSNIEYFKDSAQRTEIRIQSLKEYLKN